MDIHNNKFPFIISTQNTRFYEKEKHEQQMKKRSLRIHPSNSTLPESSFVRNLGAVRCSSDPSQRHNPPFISRAGAETFKIRAEGSQSSLSSTVLERTKVFSFPSSRDGYGRTPQACSAIATRPCPSTSIPRHPS